MSFIFINHNFSGNAELFTSQRLKSRVEAEGTKWIIYTTIIVALRE